MQNSAGIVRKPRLGGDIDAYCGRCKEEREHVIVALDERGAIARVQCRTCQSLRNYRAAKKPPASTRTGRAAAVTPTEGEVGPVVTYSMQQRFRVGERIEHPKFGIGTVIETRYDKIDVRFGKEVRTLIHAG